MNFDGCGPRDLAIVHTSNGGDPCVTSLASVFTAASPHVCPGRNRNLHADVGVSFAAIYAKRGQITSCAFLSQQGSPQSPHSCGWAKTAATPLLQFTCGASVPEAIHVASDRATPQLHFRRPPATRGTFRGGRSHSGGGDTKQSGHARAAAGASPLRPRRRPRTHAGPRRA